GNTVILSGPSGPPVTSVPSQNSELVLTPNVPDIMVTPPEDEHLRHVIDTMALYVLDGGCAFEQAIMERGRGNPLFNFLFVLGSKEHTYYVWRLYSFAQACIVSGIAKASWKCYSLQRLLKSGDSSEAK
ncbi:U2 snRNP-associated SURP motif-containing protein-like, partial [Trifolium medium]|nr:U2 snRNP-associated SURP motif-containing protein-like [Trifolium medium]